MGCHGGRKNEGYLNTKASRMMIKCLVSIIIHLNYIQHTAASTHFLGYLFLVLVDDVMSSLAYFDDFITYENESCRW